MLTDHQFAFEEVLPSWWANAVGHFLSILADGFELTFAGANITVPAGAGDQAAVIAVEGLWRFSEQAITRTHPGGAAGTYSIFVTAAANSVNGTTDNTNYAFGIAIVASGATPTLNAGVVDVARQVGTCTWDGAEITAVNQTVPALAGAAPAIHASQHAATGADPVTPAAIGTLTTAQINEAIEEAIVEGTTPSAVGTMTVNQINTAIALAVSNATAAIGVSPGDKKFSKQTADHGVNPAGGAAWLLINTQGRQVSAETYPALAALYGSSGGMVTLPSPAQRSFIAAGSGGVDQNGVALTARNPGQTGGVEQDTNLIEHDHGVSDPGHGHGVADPGHAHIINSWSTNDLSGGSAEGGQAEWTFGALEYEIPVFAGVATGQTQGSGTGVGVEGAETGITVEQAGNVTEHNNMTPFLVENAFIKT